MSTKLNTNLNAVELTQDELNFVTGGMSTTQAAGQINAAAQANAAAQMNATSQDRARRLAQLNAASKNIGNAIKSGI
jgi:hypothetical protein